MSPSAIARIVRERGVQLAALTDHNSALNCPAFDSACRKEGIIPLFGIEAQGQEECHILCLFSRPEEALRLSGELYDLMPPVMNIPEKMGDQVYVDEHDDILGEVDKYLVTSADIDLDGLCKRVDELGGIVIPAHVDRPAFSLTSQLGFVPDGPWAALEVVRMGSVVDTRGYPLITSSDAHYIEHIGRRPFELDTADDELIDGEGRVRIDILRAALSRRPRQGNP